MHEKKVVRLVFTVYSTLVIIKEMVTRYNCFPELDSIPYPNQTLKTNFSKTPRQKSKVKLYSDRTRLTL